MDHQICVPRNYPAPPLRKHQPSQESDGQTGSWCLDKAVLAQWGGSSFHGRPWLQDKPKPNVHITTNDNELTITTQPHVPVMLDCCPPNNVQRGILALHYLWNIQTLEAILQVQDGTRQLGMALNDKISFANHL